MFWAVFSIKNNRKTHLLWALMSTLFLGLMFAYFQWKGWGELVDSGVFFIGNPSGSFFYVLTGLHLAHIVSGLLSLIWVLVKALTGKYHSGNYLGVRNAGIYWHFLDILWVYLFLFLLFIR